MSYSEHDIFAKPLLRVMVSAWCGFFGFSMGMFALHFIYRYFVASGSSYLKTFDGSGILVWLAVPFTYGIGWTLICHFGVGYPENIDNTLKFELLTYLDWDIDHTVYIGPYFYQKQLDGSVKTDIIVLSSMITLCVIVISSILAITYCGIKCYLKINKLLPIDNRSRKSQRLQSQLFYALICETLIPIILMHCPALVLMISTMLNNGLAMISGTLTISISLFPALDPLPTMFIIKSYRCAIIVDIPVTVFVDETIKNAKSIAELARDDVLGFAPNVTLTSTIYTTSSCDQKPSDSQYVNEFFQNYYLKNYRITIGPTCLPNFIRFGNLTAEVESLQMNILTSYPFNHPSMIDLVTRSPRNLAENLIAIAKGFDWNQIAVVYCSSCYADDILAAENSFDSIVTLLNDNSVNVRAVVSVDKSASRETIASQLSVVSTAARIIVAFLGNSLSDHVEFMGALQIKNFTRQEYLPVMVISKYMQSYTYPWVTDTSKLDMFDKTLLIYNNFYQNTSSFSSKFSFTNDDDRTVSYQFYEAFWVLGKYLANAQTNTTVFNYIDPEATISKSSFDGPFGTIMISSEGQRVAGYSIVLVNKNASNGVQQLDSVGFKSSTCSETPCLVFVANGSGYETIKDIPLCGFNGEICDQSTVIYSIVGTMAILLCFIIFYAVFRKVIRGSKTRNMRNPWLIPSQDVLFIDLTNTEGSQHLSIQSLQRKIEEKQEIQKKIVATKGIATVDNTYVVVDKFLMRERVRFDRAEAAQLLKMKTSMQHDNLNSFVGFSLDKNMNLYVIWAQCFRGSLADIVFPSKDQINRIDININLQSAFVRDILKGLEYLHSAQGLGYHGALTSYSCMIDSHWILKLSGFGINDFLVKWRKRTLIYTHDNTPVISSKELHYYAPEVRKMWKAPAGGGGDSSGKTGEDGAIMDSLGAKRADMYSFGMVLHEILFNKKNNTFEDKPGEQCNLIDEADEVQVVYPTVPSDEDVHPELITLLHKCFDGKPKNRPDPSLVRKITSSILKMTGSLVDQMMKSMESYTSGLEKTVAVRTEQLAIEQEKANNLLSELLPKSIADELKAGKRVHAKTYPNATIMYSDIVGFTSLCSESEPMEVVALLSGMYQRFDLIITSQAGYKMETIGDAYCVAAGLPIECETEHVRSIALIALLQRDFLHHFEIPHRRGQYLKCRWGFNSGEVFSGVIGIRAPRYACFGSSAAIAAKMESTGVPDNIQMTITSQQLLAEYYPSFITEPRGNRVKVEGIGLFITYFLRGYENEGVGDDETDGEEGPNLLKEYFTHIQEELHRIESNKETASQ